MAEQKSQNKNAQEILKEFKADVAASLNKTQALFASLREQIRAINAEVAKRDQQFAAEKAQQLALEQQRLREAEEDTEQTEPSPGVPIVGQEPEPVPQISEEPAEKPIDDKPTQSAAAPKVVVETKPEKPAAAVPLAKTQPTVTTKVENGREVKTYTDERGNVRVRKFLDTSAVAKKPQPARTPATGNTGRYADRNRPVAPQARGAVQTNFPPVNVKGDQKSHGNKNKTHEKSDEKRSPSRKNLITKTFDVDYDEDKVVRRARTKRGDAQRSVSQAQKITNAVVTTSEVPIKLLSEKIGISVAEIIKQLFKENIFKTINDSVDFDYAAYIAGLYGVTLELKAEKSAEELIAEETDDDGLENDTKRPPIVTVMGHVDHGKTSLLDAIRNTRVTSQEAGGITQHIGAYTVEINGETITFIDTPGHAAFTAMRARGAKITDVSIIVVAADDGVMPQTIEAINHSKAAGVSIVVAINKMDKPDINVDRVKQQLSELELLAEDWGGDTIMVPVSAKTGMGISQLLESVLLVTEIKELKANPNKRAVGTVIEAKLDKGRGPVATVLVSNGTLHVGDNVIAGFATGKIRAMFDDRGKKVKSAGPSMPVEVLGFSEVPQAGDFMHVADEKLVRKAAEERKNKVKSESAKQAPAMNLGDLFGKISEGQLKTLNLIVKTDVQGSLEALKSSLEKISNDEVKVSCIHGGVGAINETDIMLARASGAIIIGFNVRADSNAKSVAERENVDIRLYNVIYDAVDDVTMAMKGMLAPKYKEISLGSVEVREVFKITGVGTVAGAYVTSGKATRSAKVRVYRNDVCVYDGNILALKRFKDDVKEVASGYECGISIENYNDIKVGDVFEIYQMEEIEQ